MVRNRIWQEERPDKSREESNPPLMHLAYGYYCWIQSLWNFLGGKKPTDLLENTLKNAQSEIFKGLFVCLFSLKESSDSRPAPDTTCCLRMIKPQKDPPENQIYTPTWTDPTLWRHRDANLRCSRPRGAEGSLFSHLEYWHLDTLQDRWASTPHSPGQKEAALAWWPGQRFTAAVGPQWPWPLLLRASADARWAESGSCSARHTACKGNAPAAGRPVRGPWPRGPWGRPLWWTLREGEKDKNQPGQCPA